MAADKTNIQMVNVQDGVTNNMYPLTNADIVNVTPQNNVPADATNSQAVFDSLGSLAFDNGENLIYLGESEEDDDLNLGNSEIDDTKESTATTYSSKKISELLEALKLEILAEISK